MRRRGFFKAALTGALFSSTGLSRGGSQGQTFKSGGRRPRIMFFHDSRHPAIYMYEPPMERQEFEAAVDELEIADDLPSWDRLGRVHELLLRFRIGGTTELDRLSFKLNGRKLPKKGMRKINQMYVMRGPRGRIFGYWFIFRLEAQQWPVKGKNRLEVILLERDPDVTPPVELRDVELEVKYLRGKHSGRGRDPEVLGGNEATIRLGIGSAMNRG